MAPRPVNLADFPPPAGLRIWIPAPHPDDFDAIGVTMRFYRRNGAELFVDVISGSASGVEDGFCHNDLDETKCRQREEEQRESLRYFGLPLDRLCFLRFPEDEDGHLRDGLEEEERLAHRLDQVSPHLVFLPHQNDTNTGHQRTARLLKQITARLKGSFTAFLIRDPKTRQSRLDAYMAFDEEAAQWKAALLRCHLSQQSRNLKRRGYGFDERILVLNQKVAVELGCPAPYAEAYELADWFH